MTQGLLTIKNREKVFIKIIVGCNGYNINLLKEAIIEKKLDNIEDIYNEAIECDFGNEECLVVMDEKNIRFKGDAIIPSLYRETFNDEKFNPRWENGTADYVEFLFVDNKN